MLVEQLAKERNKQQLTHSQGMPRGGCLMVKLRDREGRA